MDSTCIGHEPCSKCGSRDNLARYDDGHGFCFGCGHYEPGESSTGAPPTNTKGRHAPVTGLIPADELEYRALTARQLTEETCRKFGYATATLEKHGPVQVAQYRDENGSVVAQKVRTKGKEFFWLGEPKRAVLYGQHTAREGGRRIIITEGEIDTLSAAQALEKWPVVSIPNGAQGAKRDLSKHLDWLNAFDEIILCFDTDAPGHEAVKDCVGLFPVGKVKVAALPLKDANAMLQAGRAGDLVAALWDARTWRPDGIKTLAEIRDKIMAAPTRGLPWWTPALDDVLYGRRTGECVAIGAGTGIGKTDFITQQIAHDVIVLGEKVGLFFLEQAPHETGKRLAGKIGKRRFHIPDGSWTTAELSTALDALGTGERVFFYDHFGSADWETIRNTIRVLHHSEGVRLFYLDHLTALAAEEEDERKALETIMAQLAQLCQELNVWIMFVSHLATPEGKPHEEGGRVMVRHFKGSRAIGFWAHFMLGLERNQQADDESERCVTTLRVLKDRYTGRGNGRTFDYGYDDETGLLFEKSDDEPAPDNSDDEDPPF